MPTHFNKIINNIVTNLKIQLKIMQFDSEDLILQKITQVLTGRSNLKFSIFAYFFKFLTTVPPLRSSPKHTIYG